VSATPWRWPWRWPWRLAFTRRIELAPANGEAPAAAT
jgi:hypothetical protein